MWSPVESAGGGDGGASGAPPARGKHSATLVGQHVYVLGGRGAGGALPLKDFWRYHLGTGQWERLPSRGEAPPALQEHSATAHNGKLYVFGGEPGPSGETPLWVYDTETGIWRKLASGNTAATAGMGSGISTVRRRSARDKGTAGTGGPSGRRGHSAHGLKDCLLIYGGYKDLRGSTNELWAFHYESEWWQQVRTSPVGSGPARHRHAAALHDQRLYVHGGQHDLRDCSDLYYYDTISRTWSLVRTPPKLSPRGRSGHAGLRAGAHFYIFGGDAGGQPCNELWRFHFATETWERMATSLQWPSPRVHCAALLVGGLVPRAAPAVPPTTPSTPAAPPPRPDSLMRELSRLSSFRLRRAARCAYSVLGERDSNESLSLPKSRSSYAFETRQPPDGDVSPIEAAPAPAEPFPREPISVPEFADMVIPTPVVSPTEAARLVYFAADEEAALRRSLRRLPKSASVRFSRDITTSTSTAVIVAADDEGELSTSDYASAERVASSGGNGFSNPHYLGPDVRGLGTARTPDSGVAGDIELQELAPRATQRATQPATQLHLLICGGKEATQRAQLPRALSLWAYRLL